MKILRNTYYEELCACWSVAVRVKECYRWFSEYDFLEPMWDYIFSKEGTPSSISEARTLDKNNKLRGKLGGLTTKIYHLELQVYDLKKELKQKAKQ